MGRMNHTHPNSNNEAFISGCISNPGRVANTHTWLKYDETVSITLCSTICSATRNTHVMLKQIQGRREKHLSKGFRVISLFFNITFSYLFFLSSNLCFRETSIKSEIFLEIIGGRDVFSRHSFEFYNTVK